MARQTQRSLSFNPSINVARRSKQQSIMTVKRDVIPIKLPTLVTRKPSRTLKPTPSIRAQAPSPLKVFSSTGTNQFSPHEFLQPIAVSSSHLASFKEHVMQDNLTQRATLRCKSPRVGSAFSRSTVFAGHETQEQTKSFRPLQGMDVGSLLSAAARNRLIQLFNKLDTDRDGHLSYIQVQKCLPANLPHAQMTFFRVLYDIISGTTYFGLQEFYATAIIVEIIAKQDSMLWKRLLDDVDFNYYHDDILELLEEFNNQCPSKLAIMTYENLLELILKRTVDGKIQRITNELQYILPNIKTMKINRLEFIALIPSIIYIESSLEHGQTLFRFRENSLLDQHMRQALLS